MRLKGYQSGDGGHTQPDHSRVAPRCPRGQLNHEVSGPGPLGETLCGATATGRREAGRSCRTTAGTGHHEWTRRLLSARQLRHATVKAPGRRWSDSRLREHRTCGWKRRGLETGPQWHGEPTLQAKAQDWKPSPCSRRASPRPTRGAHITSLRSPADARRYAALPCDVTSK
jgi:hypothetical protein